MNNFNSYREMSIGSSSAELPRALDQRSKQELVRDAMVFSPPINPDTRLVNAIREMNEKKTAEPA